MEKTIKIFKAFSEKGYRAALSHTIEGLDELPLNHSIRIAETALLCEWLRVNHGIWVTVGMIPFEKGRFFEYSICDFDNCLKQNGVYESPQEAYSAAFDFIINSNLI